MACPRYSGRLWTYSGRNQQNVNQRSCPMHVSPRRGYGTVVFAGGYLTMEQIVIRRYKISGMQGMHQCSPIKLDNGVTVSRVTLATCAFALLCRRMTLMRFTIVDLTPRFSVFHPRVPITATTQLHSLSGQVRCPIP